MYDSVSSDKITYTATQCNQSYSFLCLYNDIVINKFNLVALIKNVVTL